MSLAVWLTGWLGKSHPLMARGVTTSHISAVGAHSPAGSRELPHLLLHTSSGSVSALHIQNLRAWLRPHAWFNQGDLLPGMLSNREQGVVCQRAREVKTTQPQRQPHSSHQYWGMPHCSYSHLVTFNNSGQNSRYRQRQVPSEVISESPQWVTSAWPSHLLRTPQLQTSVGRSSLLSLNHLYSVDPLLVPHLLHQHILWMSGLATQAVAIWLSCSSWLPLPRKAAARKFVRQ